MTQTKQQPPKPEIWALCATCAELMKDGYNVTYAGYAAKGKCVRCCKRAVRSYRVEGRRGGHS